MSAIDWLARRAELSPSRPAIVDPERGERISYREWNLRAERVARALVSAGVSRGDRVAVLAENASEVLDLLFACGKLGAVFLPLNWRLADRELERIVAHAGPRVIAADGGFGERAAGLCARCAARSAPQRLRIAALASGPLEVGPLPPVELAPSDPWVLCYTGGSTGTPKGVVQTHGSIAWNAIDTVATWGIGPEDVAILNAPLFHTGGLHVFTTPLVHVGGTSILCRRFDPAQVFALLAAEPAPTLLFGVPTMFLRLVEHPAFAGADLSRLRIVISGGAPAPARLFETFFARGVAFRSGYGLTEAGPNNFWLPPELARDKPGSVGWPLLHIEARLVGDGERPITAADQVGQLYLRGPHLMAGYFEEPEATAAVVSRAGWLATGDLARRDTDGAFWIVGRAAEMFITGGENVYPAEVEDALCDHPAVLEAAVVGAPEPTWGEVGVAFVVLRGETPSPGQLDDFLAGRLARYKRPRCYQVLSELPRTGASKIDRVDLRRRAILIAAAAISSKSA